ncbi:16S rRNA (cytosine(967)-C(5))-methyltransferase [Prochlorococcus marinus]|uniref:16S rRNA (cytosine(967)-C(5))-methyltransferase n=1 Tax=Prochlorococcus marinus TaxID=1219 RepID=UPI0022B35E6B|nr:16S rRNA (cytosine(967)-C(5))-methyltransferase [Prochlorococcus marinus]
MSEELSSIKGLDARKAAWEVIQAVGGGAFADVALERIFNLYSFKSLDKALITELSYGAIRQRYFLDCWIDSLGKVPANKQPPLLRWLLHLGLYQILKMKRIPPAAAINTTVELAKTHHLKKLAPVVNGILRSALRRKEKGLLLPISNNPSLELAKNESLPIWLAKELISWKGVEHAKQIAKAFNSVSPIDIRVNKLRADLKDVKELFDSCGIQNQVIPNCPSGLEVRAGGGEPRKWPGYEEGKWSVQDRSSQLIAPSLGPLPGENILDACAAPGGKSTHIAELMNNEGKIWSVDRSSRRSKKIFANSERLGTNCLHLLVADSNELLVKYPEWKNFFDRILIDAPCSGLGTLARHPDARWRMNRDNIQQLVLLQSQLLNSLAPLLKNGGTLVYSTCTIHPEENFNQIKNFLQLKSEFLLEYEKQIWPGQEGNGDGFYIAVLNKLKNQSKDIGF